MGDREYYIKPDKAGALLSEIGILGKNGKVKTIKSENITKSTILLNWQIQCCEDFVRIRKVCVSSIVAVENHIYRLHSIFI